MMRTVGLITEYNPFHNGHLHHLREGLRTTGSDVAVAVMSGHFLQRGEPALIDKWSRTEMALAAGVDLVVELPLPWACSSAPDFARGGVLALNALGGIDTLCFGSESGQLEPLQQCVNLLVEKGEEVASRTAELLRQGMNYPRARAELLAELLPESLAAELLAAPNNILGIEYLKALQQTGSRIKPVTIKRIGAGYHDTEVGVQNIASATGIRRRLVAGEPVESLIPPVAIGPLQAGIATGLKYDPEKYFSLLLTQIMRDPPGLTAYWLVENGIENRLLTVAEQAESLDELIGEIKARQLTRTRIQRLLVSILLGIKKTAAQDLLTAGPRYLHLLGVSEKGERFLAATRKQRSLPLVQNFSRVHNRLKRFYGVDTAEQQLAHQQLDLELRATKIYTLLLQEWSGGERNRDFYEMLRKGR